MAGQPLYQTVDVPVPANGSVTFEMYGSYVQCLESNLTEFRIGFDDSSTQVMAQGFHAKAEPGERFRSITIDNSDNASALSVRLAVGSGDFRDSRLTTSAPLDIKTPTIIPTTADTALVALTAAEILAANVNRKEALITNLGLSALSIRVGDSNVGAARGQPVAPGQTVTLETTAAIWGFSTPGETVTLLEIEK